MRGCCGSVYLCGPSFENFKRDKPNAQSALDFIAGHVWPCGVEGKTTACDAVFLLFFHVNSLRRNRDVVIAAIVFPSPVLQGW